MSLFFTHFFHGMNQDYPISRLFLCVYLAQKLLILEGGCFEVPYLAIW